MKKISSFFQIALIVSANILYLPCYAQSLTSIELISNAKEYDGKTLTYQAEVVGDIMIRNNGAWLSLNDGLNALGVWINKDLVKDIQYTGNYKAKGDILEVFGTFHRSCPEHGGDLDIHAQKVVKVSSGIPVSQVIEGRKIKISLFLFLLIIVFRFFHKFLNKSLPFSSKSS